MHFFAHKFYIKYYINFKSPIYKILFKEKNVLHHVSDLTGLPKLNFINAVSKLNRMQILFAS